MRQYRFRQDGTRLVIDPVKGAKLARVEMYIPLGWVHSPPGKEELCHVTEHMVANGFPSARHPVGKDNMMLIHRLGITMNAYTSAFNMMYYVEGLAADINTMLDLFLNVFTSFRAEESILEKEKHAVRNELAMRLNEQMSRPGLADAIRRALFPKHPHGHTFTVKKRIESLGRITVMDVQNHWNAARYFGGSYSLFVVTGGGFTTASVVRRCRDHFRDYRQGDVTPAFRVVPLGRMPLRRRPRTIVLRSAKGVTTTRVQVMIPHNVPSTSPDYMLLQRLLPILLTADFNHSRLYRRLRSELGLIYSIRSGVYESPGGRTFFSVLTEVQRVEDVRTVCRVIQEEMWRVLEEPVTEDEFRVFKRAMTVAWLQNNNDQSLSARCDLHALRHFFGARLLTQREVEARIRRLDPQSFRRFLARHLNMRSMTLFLSTPGK